MRIPVVALTCAVLLPQVLMSAALAGPGRTAPADAGVGVRVVNIAPDTPRIATRPQPVVVTLELLNTTATTFTGVVISAFRGDPLESQTALDRSFRAPSSDPNLRAPLPDLPAPDLAPGADLLLSYPLTDSSVDHAGDLCLCRDAIYPLWFTASRVGTDGTSTELGHTVTYVPSFTAAPAPLQVAWVWPLLDRPHRATPQVGADSSISDTVFLDDRLADEVRPGGRLDHLLQVVQDVAPNVAMTVVVDPEILDELAVMAAGSYTVAPPAGSAAGAATAGTGSAAASAWLARLRAVLPRIDLAFTPPADPDVESLARHGLGWTNGLEAQAQARVTAALGGATPLTDITWPVNDRLPAATLAQLARQGTRTVLLAESAFTDGSDVSPVRDALAALSTPSGEVTAALTSANLQRWVRQVVVGGSGTASAAGAASAGTGATGLAALPQLVAMVAIRAVTSTRRPHVVVLSPPRTIGDVVPAVADRALLETADTQWSAGVGLRTLAATEQVLSAGHGALRAVAATTSRGLPARALHTLRTVTDTATRLVALFPASASGGNVAAELLGGFSTGIQRCETSEWISHPGAVGRCARALRDRLAVLSEGVHIVKPVNGSYTLASRTASLPLTITNTLDVAVQVEVRIASTTGSPLFTAGDIGPQLIPANRSLQVKVPTRVERPGRNLVAAQLSTTSGLPLGEPVELSVRSTALGTIGIVITVVAGVVLVLALVVRFALRLGRRPGRVADTSDATT